MKMIKLIITSPRGTDDIEQVIGQGRPAMATEILWTRYGPEPTMWYEPSLYTYSLLSTVGSRTN